MINIRRSNDRGHAQHGWLESYHTFSFANYHDPKFNGFRDLLVINDDRVQPGQGFGKHGHRDMEIITYMVEGELEHKDSMGTGSVIRPGDIQRMSAGKGVQHSEFNHSKDKPLHLLQIWITPAKEGDQPSYEEKKFTAEEKKNRLKLIVSPTGEDGSVTIHQNAKLYSGLLDEGKEVDHQLAPGRHAWVQVIKGALDLNGESLMAGDGAAISETGALNFVARENTEVLLFDLA
ncbi:MAG: pirin family protein [Methylotenera sp.]|nr:pirin family protein [Oligoflexia bacterium]